MNILFTRKLNSSQIALSKEYHLNVDAIQFIDVELKSQSEILKLFSNELKYNSIIFTSLHAAKAMIDLFVKGLIKVPENFYCVGQKTAKPLTDAGFKVTIPKTNDLQGVISLINGLLVKQDLLYCRGNLGRSLRTEDFKLKNNIFEIQVYQTILLKNIINTEKYDGIVFQSPSAVRAFFQSPNTPDKKVILFSGGKSTADEILKYSQNKLMISHKPEVENILLMVKKYFNNELQKTPDPKK